jgi:ferredoxin
MLFRIIDKTELPSLVAGLQDGRTLVGPVQRDGHCEFALVTAAEQMTLDYTQTIIPPKKYLLPVQETLFSYGAAQAEDIQVGIEALPLVIFGVHACDINAINRLDTVFMGEKYVDPYYRARREATMIVGISCTPAKECLCGLWGTGDAHSGYDLFLYDLGEVYLVSMHSVEGADILEASCSPRLATAEEILAFEIQTKQFHDCFAGLPDTAKLPMLMDVLHKHPIWEELGERCLSCTACSTSCPTCYCFDLLDLPDGIGGSADAQANSGRRCRVWDSCNSPGFAVVAGGHNFRDSGRNRVRHRFYHKLLSYMTRYGDMLCVGCGRCVRSCKAYINPRTVIEGLYRERDNWLAATPSSTAAPQTPPAEASHQ